MKDSATSSQLLSGKKCCWRVGSIYSLVFFVYCGERLGSAQELRSREIENIVRKACILEERSYPRIPV